MATSTLPAKPPSARPPSTRLIALVAALSVLTMADPKTGRELLTLGENVSAAADTITARLRDH
jgi:hypothetical protein